MENEYYLTGELSHHGVLGMKWGVRKDRGTSSSGTMSRRQAKKLMKKAAQIKAAKAKADKKAAEEEAKKIAKRTVKDFTDSELDTKIRRLEKEKRYSELRRDVNNLNPKTVSAGKKFAKTLVNDVVAPAAKNTGRQWLEKQMAQALGLNEQKKDGLSELRREAETLRLQKEISGYKKEAKNRKSGSLSTKEKNEFIKEHATDKAYKQALKEIEEEKKKTK